MIMSPEILCGQALIIWEEAHWPGRSSVPEYWIPAVIEKDGYYFYQSIWKRREPMAHLLPHWNINVEKGTIIQVLGYTNCEYAELFLNGRSYGKKHIPIRLMV